jgi:hypothetical protein
MENTTNAGGQMENTQIEEKEIVITEEIKDYLLVSAKWSKFVAIVGFIGLGIFTLIGFLMMLGLPILHRINTSVPVLLYGFFYIILAVVNFFPMLYLYRFAESIKQGILRNDDYEMTNGFLNLKKMTKFTGIMMIVILGIYALLIVISVPAMILMNR